MILINTTFQVLSEVNHQDIEDSMTQFYLWHNVDNVTQFVLTKGNILSLVHCSLFPLPVTEAGAKIFSLAMMSYEYIPNNIQLERNSSKAVACN